MFRNYLFNQQPFVIGIAMAAEAWSYAVFHRFDKPIDFDLEEVWILPNAA